jgi:hypothetical protein
MLNDFELHAAKNKIVAILNWKFSVTLKTLEIYLEFIEWLRDYVAWYAQKVEFLQQKKIMLLRNSSYHKEFVRKAYFVKILVKNSTDRERRFFDLIQAAFKNSQFLTHFDIVRQFLINVNVFKEEFETFVYHIKKERDEMTKFTTVQFIVFLSKILISAEKRYWLTKLEVAAVVWMIKKLHHMIKTFKYSTIIWIDHAVTTVIVKQTKMITSNTDKLNLRLVRVEMYLSQFELDIRHKFDRDHVISDALFRLSSFDEKFMKNQNIDTLDDIETYVDTLMKMTSQFKNRLVQDYKTNKQWSFLYEMLVTISSTQMTRRAITNDTSVEKNSVLGYFSHERIEFERRDDLIYHLNRFISRARLCISKSLMQNIFKMTHDDFAHVDFHRAYVVISETFYIRRLSHYLRHYINYCSQCLLNQTKRHKSYDVLNFISSSKISFHIITMNFVLTLSQSRRKKFDILFTITDKFFKSKLLISELNNWKAKDWALALWKYLQLFNWDLSRVIIFDRDAKFRFDLWKILFKVVEIDLLISAVYHSQTDDQSERTNQTIEIAFRYLLTSNSDLSWHEALSSMQQTLMNIITSTKHVSNEVLYEMKTRSQLIWLSEEVFENNQQLLREIIRKDVADVINFANARFKVIYDDKHKCFAFNSEDKTYLRLHHEYSLLEKENSKLSNQRSDSYIILRKIGNQAYVLNLSTTSRIHSVIFIAQLKFASKSDSFDRSRSINSKLIEINDDTAIKKSFEVERVLKKRNKKYDKITIVQYLIKWKSWELEHNFWVSAKDCSNFMNLIMNFENRQSATTRDWFLNDSVSHDVIMFIFYLAKNITIWIVHERILSKHRVSTLFNVYQTSLIRSIAEFLRHEKCVAYRIVASTRTLIFLEKMKHLSRLCREFESSRLRSRFFCTCLTQTSFVQIDKFIAYS